VDLVGGIRRFVQPGQRVLIKPNLLRKSLPEEAIVTHPFVVRAITRLVLEAGGRPLIGDSPGGLFSEAALRGAYQAVGLRAVAEETGAELNYDLNVTRVAVPDGTLMKALEWCQYATQADVIISVPKLKTHGFMGFTGATKNLFGLIPGVTKGAYHAKLRNAEQFAEMLLDILVYARPALTLMDGIVAMDGDGPSGGSPFPLGVLLASSDAIALDVAATQLVGLRLDTVLPLRAAKRRGLTSGLVDDVEIVGDSFAAASRPGFRPARTGISNFEFAPGFLRRAAIGHIVASPHPTDACKRCNICVQNCPVKAIRMPPSGPAQIDLGQCIRCYCCHEMCPHRAIELKLPLLAKLVK
jgi:uncharacterized protein (DUF362 family)/NAD-dependent dihydropyrimidine dehydrogenase PreA subunit